MPRASRLTLVAATLLAVVGRAYGSPQPMVELLRVRLVNDAGGAIAVSRDRGLTWRQVGQVLRYTTQVNPRGYTASKWVPPGRVAATAVNAIHIMVGYNAVEDRGVVFSLLPREFLAAPEGYPSFLSPDSSIYTDLPAGRGLFGGGASPLVGNQVYSYRPDGAMQVLGPGYVPARGDVLVIVVERPARYPVATVLENRPGGGVTLEYADGASELLGWVVKPVAGVGRFAGSVHAGIGRLRANHAGVLEVSTSPLGELGAFQIIPFAHACSPEMGNAWQLTQWLIVGPAREGDALWDGLSPLFWQHLRPDYLPEDLLAADWEQRLLARFLVEVDLGRGWQPMPARRLSADPSAPLPEWAHLALGEVKRLRILFPLAQRELGTPGPLE